MASSLINELELLGEAVRKAEGSRFSPEYLAFIDSPEWQEKRAERIRLDTVNGQVICQFCGKPCTKDDPPEVDHFRYPPKGSPVQAFIEQPIEDLRTLHRSCHALKTELSRQQPKAKNKRRNTRVKHH